MSSSYSANQYDGAFTSQRLQSWSQTKSFKERPTAQEGHTTFIADDRGHLLPGVVKRGSAWPDFKGTWDLPARIPVPRINPTGRSVEGLSRLKSWGISPAHTGEAQPHGRSKNPGGQEAADNQTRPRSSAAPSAAEVQPASQNDPVIGGQNAAKPDQEFQAAVVGSVPQSAADKQVSQATEKDSALGQCPVAEDEPASSLTAGTSQGRPVSRLSVKASASMHTHRNAQ